MCGIAGFTLPMGLAEAEREAQFGPRLRAMVASLYHRGPDAQRGLLLDGVALGHTRLSIVDLAHGHQPMRDPATGVTVVFNGEVFNHQELRAALAPTYAFRTRSDTEVLLAAFLRDGIDCVGQFVGQFAFAVFDPRDGALWLARDRLGIRPLYYAQTAEGLAFGSEAKALFAAGWLKPSLDAAALKDSVHLWAPASPRSAFEGVHALPPGVVARWHRGALESRRYWDLDLDPGRVERGWSLAEATAQVEAALEDAVRLRLRADVPVAAYLSGGLDSSLICAFAQEALAGSLSTFSVAFAQARYDERGFQEKVAAALHTQHRAVEIQDAEIGALLPAVVEHGEQVLLRTAPAPFLKLSRWVRDHRIKVVLTGEGADEVFLGYDLFKETLVRSFWARRSHSTARPQLFRRLYPYLPLSAQSPELLRAFYGIGLDHPGAPDFSHQIRWTNSGRVARFFSRAFAEKTAGHDPGRAVIDAAPAHVWGWPPLLRAQYLEAKTLLSGYLLSAQGDRMLMGNSVEGRFPFLDHRLVELAARLPTGMKLRGLTEKVVLRRVARGRVPEVVSLRPKFPYRAPVAEALVGPAAPGWSRELLAREAVDSVGVFDGEKVSRLVAKLSRPGGAPPSEADNMALVAVATTQLLARAFLQPVALSAQRLSAVEVRAE